MRGARIVVWIWNAVHTWNDARHADDIVYRIADMTGAASSKQAFRVLALHPRDRVLQYANLGRRQELLRLLFSRAATDPPLISPQLRVP